MLSIQGSTVIVKAEPAFVDWINVAQVCFSGGCSEQCHLLYAKLLPNSLSKFRVVSSDVVHAPRH
jgi:hypothetical protein